MVFILAYYYLYRWTCYLQAFGHFSQGWTRLVEVYSFFFSGFGLFLLIFPWCQAKRHWVWSYTSNWLKCHQLAYQKLLKAWNHILEFSKLFKGTVNVVYVNFWPTGIVIQWMISEIICLNNCWKDYLGCLLCARHPNRLAKTIVCWQEICGWKTGFNDSNLSVCKLLTSNCVCVCVIYIFASCMDLIF